VELRSDTSTDNQHFYSDVIEFGAGEMYVAGHTEVPATFAKGAPKKLNRQRAADCEIKLDDYELRLTPRDKGSALKVARRSPRKARSTVGR
jgi:hypothetical protein